MDDDDEAIAQFLRERGATVCPPAFVAPTTTPMTFVEEQQRLGQLTLQPWLTAKALRRATQHAQRGRQRAVVAGKGPRPR